VPTYLSTHIIACMTRQALNQLIATLQAAHEVMFIRASASQMVGRLVCEFEASDQETLLRFLEEHHVAYEWIIRVELTWSGAQPSAAAAPEAMPQAKPEAAPAGQANVPTVAAPAAVEVPSAPPVTEKASPSTFALGEASEAKILHILRALKDESAWRLIMTQRQMQPVAVLLLHDAVLAPPPLDVPMFACEADVLARGIASPLPLLTYDQIVELVFACERVMVW
jgi:sulfur transfer complex TusBCD TusB component (DsrH family)